VKGLGRIGKKDWRKDRRKDWEKELGKRIGKKDLERGLGKDWGHIFYLFFPLVEHTSCAELCACERMEEYQEVEPPRYYESAANFCLI